MEIRNRLYLVVSCITAVALGWMLPYLQLYAMQFFIPISPVPRLLQGLGLEGSAFSIALYPFDFLFHTISSLPIAIAIYVLRPRHLVLYTSLAVLPLFFALFSHLLFDGTFELSIGMIQTAITTLFALPFAVLLVHLAWCKVRPNNAFKPTPLHGAA